MISDTDGITHEANLFRVVDQPVGNEFTIQKIYLQDKLDIIHAMVDARHNLLFLMRHIFF